MSLGRLLTACLVAAPLMISAPETRAQNRPDIPDIVDGQSGIQLGTPVLPITSSNTSVIFVANASDGSGSFYGQIRKYVNTIAAAAVGVEGFMELRLYEPDKIQRKADKTQMKQKTFVTGTVYVNTPAASFSAGISVGDPATVDCRGAVKLGHNNVGVVSSRKWSLQCKESVIQSLGVNASQLSALKALFGADNKLKLAGKHP